MSFNVIGNYVMQVLILLNSETSESELMIIDEKYQYKYELIFNNAIDDTK